MSIVFVYSPTVSTFFFWFFILLGRFYHSRIFREGRWRVSDEKVYPDSFHDFVKFRTSHGHALYRKLPASSTFSYHRVAISSNCTHIDRLRHRTVAKWHRDASKRPTYQKWRILLEGNRNAGSFKRALLCGDAAKRSCSVKNTVNNVKYVLWVVFLWKTISSLRTLCLRAKYKNEHVSGICTWIRRNVEPLRGKIWVNVPDFTFFSGRTFLWVPRSPQETQIHYFIGDIYRSRSVENVRGRSHRQEFLVVLTCNFSTFQFQATRSCFFFN